MKIKQKVVDPIGFSMTPLIDVVFQLIIFFMLVTDFVSTQLEAVYLPKASEVQEDERPDKDRLIINLAHYGDPPGGRCSELKYDIHGKLVTPCQNEAHWKIRIENRDVRVPELESLLVNEGNLEREPSPEPGKLGLSNRIVMVRADAAAPYKILEKVLSACARARIWKIEVGASKPPE